MNDNNHSYSFNNQTSSNDNAQDKEKKTRTKKTLAQEIASLEQTLANKKARHKEQTNQQKIVLGGMMLAIARKDKHIARQLQGWINSDYTRAEDKRRLKPVLDELDQILDD